MIEQDGWETVYRSPPVGTAQDRRDIEGIDEFRDAFRREVEAVRERWRPLRIGMPWVGR